MFIRLFPEYSCWFLFHHSIFNYFLIQSNADYWQYEYSFCCSRNHKLQKNSLESVQENRVKSANTAFGPCCGTVHWASCWRRVAAAVSVISKQLWSWYLKQFASRISSYCINPGLRKERNRGAEEKWRHSPPLLSTPTFCTLLAAHK